MRIKLHASYCAQCENPELDVGDETALDCESVSPWRSCFPKQVFAPYGNKLQSLYTSLMF